MCALSKYAVLECRVEEFLSADYITARYVKDES